jgi:general secretion pathway protein G
MTRLTAHNRRQSVVRRHGFTLVEVLLVLAILGVIAAMVVPNLLGQQKAALIKTTGMSIKSLEDACKTYAISHDGEYPANIEQLMTPGNDKDGKPIAPYLEKPPKDAWGNMLSYSYESGALKPKIWSWGPNKADNSGSEDDITN